MTPIIRWIEKFRDVFRFYISPEFPIQLTNFFAAHPVVIKDHAIVFIVTLNSEGKFIWQGRRFNQQIIMPFDIFPNIGLVIGMYAKFANNLELADAHLFAQFAPKSIQ